VTKLEREATTERNKVLN